MSGIVLQCLFCSVLHAATIHVPADQPTIQDCIDAAVDGDTVLVAPGRYQGYGNRGLYIIGKAVVVRSSQGSLRTIIDCEKVQRGLRINSCGDLDTRFEGFTIANGSSSSNGGGIEIRQSSPHISDCIIRNCEAPNAGGILVYDDSSPIIRECIVFNNTGHVNAGGILCSGGKSLIEDCVIAANTVLAFEGGGIWCEAGDSTTIRNCLIAMNHADNQGGGVYCIHSNSILKDCTIIGNSTELNSGGGIYSNGSSLIFYRCVIINNSAARGGGIYVSGSSLSMSNCIVSLNSAQDAGGGAYCVYPWTYAMFKNCIFYSNSAVEEAGAIRCVGASIFLINSICWSDSAPVGTEIYVGSGEVTIDHSDIQWGEDSVYVDEGATLNWLEGNITGDPMFADTTNGDFHLLQGSPCIDAGDSSVLDSCKPPGKGRFRSDMGAYGGESNCWSNEPVLGRTIPIGPDLENFHLFTGGGEMIFPFSSDPPAP